MEELKKAIQIRQKYISMDFDSFSKLVEIYIGREIPQNEKDDFKYTGLCNVDFFRMYVDC